jgi:hypothetical protein
VDFRIDAGELVIASLLTIIAFFLKLTLDAVRTRITKLEDGVSTLSLRVERLETEVSFISRRNPRVPHHRRKGESE